MATETRERDFPFTLTRAQGAEDDGLTFEGYAAVFNSPTHIEERDGEYDEVIAPGAFKRSIDRSTPVLMFNHGKHPLIGQMPLGKITELREDARGLFVKARLTDNWLIQPVRDAIADKAVTGMSFRFEVVKDNWTGAGSQQLRTLREVKVPELGPVVMPAYSDTTALVRSSIRSLEAFAETEGITPTDRAGFNVGDDWSVTQMVEDALETHMGLNDQTQDVYTINVVGDRITFVVTNPVDASQSGLWQSTFTYTDGTVTVTDPAPVTPTEYAPRAADTTGMTRVAAVTGQSRATDPEIIAAAQAVDAAIDGALKCFDPTDDDYNIAQGVALLGAAEASSDCLLDLLGAVDADDPRSLELVGEERAKYTADQIKTMVKSGAAMSDGGYPIGDKQDLQNAIHAVGRGGTDHNTIRQHIIKRAKALGASDMIPDTWNTDGSMTGMNSHTEGPSEELAVTGPSEELATTPTLDASSLAERRRYARQIMAGRRAS